MASRDGLSAEEAQRRLATTGPNVIFTPSPVTFLDILWEEIREPMILLLLVVGVLYSLLGEPGDALTIFVVITLLTLAEVQNEFRAKRAIQRLAEIASPKAAVIRDGELQRIEAAAIVPGDSLVLAAGTKIAADGRISATPGLSVDESAITGESFPADKAVGDEIFAGTVVVAGDGTAEVMTTGRQTRLGSLAEGLKQVKPPKTPLQRAMKELSGKLVWVAVFFSTAIPLLGLLRGQRLQDMVLTGLSLAFATIPEELPIIITMVLGLGAYRLSRQSFLVKRLAAAETMGAVDVIVTDKTGTLTESRMTLDRVHSSMSDPEAITVAMGAVSPIDATPIDLAVRDRANASNAAGDASEIIAERGIGDGSKTKAVLRASGMLYVSGAPEEVFARCVSVPDDVRATLDQEAAEGRREVAVASRAVPEGERSRPLADLERGMVFAALLSFSDPPRPEVPQAIANMTGAGVRTIMVTGDHPATAAAIAREVGIGDGGTRVVTGPEIDGMDDQALSRTVESVSVFARTTPQHKYRIVNALQQRGLLVAATGDGVNDALALKGADIGIAMGVRGTDVAKEAASAVLADDDYATIAHAIFEGRVFYDNLRKGVKYYLSVKVALIAVFLLPAVLGTPMPFSPVQIILLELFMDLAASAGFVAEPGEPDIHTRLPGEMKRKILDRPQALDLTVKGAFLFTAVMAVYGLAAALGLGVVEQRTLAFWSWMIGHVALAFVSRSDRDPLSEVGFFSNRVVDLWAVATVVFLLVGTYVAPVAHRIGLTPVPGTWLLGVALGVSAWMSLLEVRKHLRREPSAAVLQRQP